MIIAATVAAGACQQQEAAPADNAADEPVLNLPSVPRPQPPLDRAALLQAVAQAASASAAGAELPQEVRSLDGRQFELRIRFGCRGPVDSLEDRWLGWSFNPEDRRIRVQAKPTISMEDQLVSSIAGDRFEAVEGFWIPRPWLQQAVCPAAAAVTSAPAQAQSDSAASTGPTETDSAAAADAMADADDELNAEPVPTWPRVGIAQFFTDQDSRTRRRDMRPYQANRTLEEGRPLSSQGYNLVLSGRLRALPNRGVIECEARDSNSPPECMISADFLRVWIERPDNREVIAEWGSG